jgi:hypothetical protein
VDLKDLFLLERHLSSSSRKEQVAALHRTLASGKMLRIAIENRWITEGQAWFFAQAHKLLANRLTTDSGHMETPVRPYRRESKKQ